MPCQPLRFLHATGLHLDAPLRGPARLDGELRAIVDEAAATALERLIAACLEHEADFLLLTGDSFDESRRSLPARLVLRDGLQRLDEQGVPVFVLPGPRDAADAWRRIPDLPETVTVLHDGDEPVAVLRDGTAIAEITAGTARTVLAASADSDPADERPFQIVLLPAAEADALLDLGASRRNAPAAEALVAAVLSGNEQLAAAPVVSRRFDYIGSGGAVRRTVTLPAGLVHCPGTTQGLSARETGTHGATLVDVAADGTIRRTLVPTAPVRWEQFPVHVNEQTIREELLDEMQFVLHRAAPEEGERLWLVTWAIHGGGPLFDTLHDLEYRRELTAALTWTAGSERGVAISHQPRLYRDGVATDDELRDNRLASLFAQRLETAVPPAAHLLLGQIGADDPALVQRLVNLAPELDPAAILSAARDLGRDWLASGE